VSRLTTIDSTNDELVRRCQRGPTTDRTVLFADVQTAGRGRLDRRWDAPPGENLLFSILFAPPIINPQRLQHAVALAVVDVARHLGVHGAVLKWPNDIIVTEPEGDGDRSDNSKLAGMLSTMTSDGSVIIGTGCNVNWAPDRATSMLAQSTTRQEVVDVLRLVLSALDKLLGLAPEQMDDLYRSRVDTIGRRVRVELPNGENVVGRATQLDADGALEVIDECAMTHRFHAADVVHLRPE
jgi:BirA family transcriptional regulator, biotin operon repressor / biotin---[acetyl-CoA-carboxylase] ligase